jgi:hypothetical protein
LNQRPILKALSSIRKSGARTLLMGGQACVFYGAAEFSRDLDLLVLTDPPNMALLRVALEDLQAHPVAVPPFETKFLERGHALHFRCLREDVAGLRIDLMSLLRGVDGFEELWGRRTTIEVDGEIIELLSPADLVLAKKTQRDKDWPMIQRLTEQSYFHEEHSTDPALVDFWLRELRTPELLIRLATMHSETATASNRPAVAAAIHGDPEKVSEALYREEREERRRDREYWEPLKRELEQLRHARGI